MEREKTEDKSFITYTEAKKILENFLKRPVAYQSAFAKVGGGGCAGIILSQAWYWTPRANKKCAGWFYKTIEEWEAETGLTYSEQTKARNELKKRGIIEEDRRWGNKIYFRIIIRRLVNLLTGDETYSEEITAGKIKRMKNLRPNKAATRNVVNGSADNSESRLSENSTLKNVETSTQKVLENSARHNREYITQNTSETSTKSSTKTTRYTQDVLDARHLEGNLSVGEINKNEIPSNAENKTPSNAAKDSQPNKRDEDISSRNTAGGIEDAKLALATFQSVGANRFDVTFKNEVSGRTQYHEDADLTVKLPRALELNETKNVSFIVRPRGAALIQVDDVDAETLEMLSPFSFFAEETSNDNYQVWLALPPNTSEVELKDTRNRLLKKLEKTSGNGGSYGATRFPGSINHKPERNGFRVRLLRSVFGSFVTIKQLEAAGLLAEVTTPKTKSNPFEIKGHPTRFPDYNKCLEAKNFDRSKADASFLAIAKARGFEMEEAVEELERVSKRVLEEKQKRRPDRYLSRTAEFIFEEEI